MILYHGSEKIIDAPEFGKGNSHNDYGRGFYCTENEELAKEWNGKLPAARISVRDGYCNLSGLENKAVKLLHDGAEKSYVADFVFSHITAVLAKLTENALEKYGEMSIIYAGGVMSNRYINKTLTERFGGLFAESQYSCDNAAGIARLTELKINGEL